VLDADEGVPEIAIKNAIDDVVALAKYPNVSVNQALLGAHVFARGVSMARYDRASEAPGCGQRLTSSYTPYSSISALLRSA
jgi:hypothetical protein